MHFFFSRGPALSYRSVRKVAPVGCPPRSASGRLTMWIGCCGSNLWVIAPSTFRKYGSTVGRNSSGDQAMSTEWWLSEERSVLDLLILLHRVSKWMLADSLPSNFFDRKQPWLPRSANSPRTQDVGLQDPVLKSNASHWVTWVSPDNMPKETNLPTADFLRPSKYGPVLSFVSKQFRRPRLSQS